MSGTLHVIDRVGAALQQAEEIIERQQQERQVLQGELERRLPRSPLGDDAERLQELRDGEGDVFFQIAVKDGAVAVYVGPQFTPELFRALLANGRDAAPHA